MPGFHSRDAPDSRHSAQTGVDDDLLSCMQAAESHEDAVRRPPAAGTPCRTAIQQDLTTPACRCGMDVVSPVGSIDVFGVFHPHGGLAHMQANLLQPLADPASLELRLDAMEELLCEAELRANVQV